MIALLLSLSLASAADPTPATPSATPAMHADTLVPQGLRITPLRGTHGVSIGSTSVLGPGGGTSSAQVSARYVGPDFSVAVRLPVAAYRVPGRRHADLGNLFVEGLYLWDAPGLFGAADWTHGFGLEAHFNPTGRPYTWVHRADELWPGTGANLVYQLHVPTSGDLDLMVRVIAGMHSAHDFQPFPGLFGQLGAAALVDWTLPAVSQLGLVGETAFTWWDLTPWEVTALLRFDPVQGVRLRGGVLLPLSNWMGFTPSQLGGGFDEFTLHFDAQMAL